MSDATTALAEVLRAHLCFADSLRKSPFPDRPFYSMCYGDDCEWESQFVATEREAEEQAASHQATFVVAAVRGLSPDLQAELAPALAEQVVELRAIKEGLESSLTKALTRMSEVRW